MSHKRQEGRKRHRAKTRTALLIVEPAVLLVVVLVTMVIITTTVVMRATRQEHAESMFLLPHFPLRLFIHPFIPARMYALHASKDHADQFCPQINSET